ncbi:MAG: hemolysin III family protein [Firmicutes bacterium]|nr:hemolysin III family protein [Bacillota bacterium]
MKDKFENFLNKKFKKVKNTKEIRELKEEIMSDLLEKSEEVKGFTNDESENYEICINSLGDLYSLIKEYKKDYRKLDKKIELPKYKLGEELINAISHGFGVLLSITALILCVLKSDSWIELFSILFYSITSIILYLMSCLYHSFKPNNAKRVFRIFDHCSIFLLIAGTYTPMVLLTLPPKLGWTIFGIVWCLAIIGIILNSIDLKKFKVISMILYLFMGWCIIFSFKTLWNSMHHTGILITLLGGITYTLGAVIYGVGKKHKYMHSIFHIFCLLASIFFFFAIYFYAL